MKIALVIERLDPMRGGRETSTAQIASALARRGHHVTVICQEAAWSLRDDGVTVKQLGARGVMRVTKLRNFISDVQAAMADGGYDIVHTTLPVPGANVYQPRGGTIPGQRAASVRRRGEFAAFIAEMFAPLNACRSAMAEYERQVIADENTVCLAVSEMVAEEIRSCYGRENGVRVIYNAVDIPAVDDEQRADWRQKLRFGMGVGPENPVFVTVAKNFVLKGVGETIKAFAMWSHDSGTDGRLVVVGREDSENYQQIAGQHDAGDKVIFVPPTENVFTWYSAADACVLLSWYDPCSRVVLEATRWRLPSITTVFNGAAEILAGGAGIVVDSPRDIVRVAAAMDELADPARRAARTAACVKIADSLGIDRHVDELEAAYSRMAGKV